ncbi:MAG: hypothetical protein WCJ56_12285 [bacterium]
MPKKASMEDKRDPQELLRMPPDGGEKKSDILLQFASPLLKGDDTIGEAKKVLYMAIIAWNLSLLPPHRRAKALASLFESHSLATQISGKKIISDLVERKQNDFAQHEWMINEIDLATAKNGKTQLSVSYVKLGEGDERRAVLSMIDGIGMEEGREIIERINIERANAAKQQQNPI